MEEKKEREAVPPVPVKDNEAQTMTPAVPPPVSAEPSVPAAAEASHTTPKDTKEGFFGRFMKQERAKSQVSSVLILHVPPSADLLYEKKYEKPGGTVTSEPAQIATTDVSGAGPSSTDKTEGTSPVSPAGEASNGPHVTKDKRRTSFFGTLGTRREKKPEVAPEVERTEGETKQKNTSTSPIPRLGGIFRMPSRGAKAQLGTGKEGAKPAEGQPSVENTVAPNQETTPTAAAEGTTTSGTGVSESRNGQGVNGAIGDVIPAAGQPSREHTSPEVPTTA